MENLSSKQDLLGGDLAAVQQQLDIAFATLVAAQRRLEIAMESVGYVAPRPLTAPDPFDNG